MSVLTMIIAVTILHIAAHSNADDNIDHDNRYIFDIDDGLNQTRTFFIYTIVLHKLVGPVVFIYNSYKVRSTG